MRKVPDTTIDPDNPLKFGISQLIAATSGFEQPITEQSTEQEIIHARKVLWGKYLSVLRARAKAGKTELLAKVKTAHEEGIAHSIISQFSGFTEEQIVALARKHRWSNPDITSINSKTKGYRGSRVRNATRDILKAEAGVTVVRNQEEDEMPPALRELHEQARMLEMTHERMGRVPFRKWGALLKLRAGRIAMRIVQQMETMNDHALTDPENVKTLKVIVGIAGEMEPKEQPGIIAGRGGVVNNFVLMGGKPIGKPLTLEAVTVPPLALGAT